MTAIELLKTNLFHALNFLKREIQEELSAQGHRASGKLIDEIDVVVRRKSANVMSGQILMHDYAEAVDKGTRPHWPRYDDIYRWAGFVQPSLSEKERQSFTYAVMTTIAREGTPSRGSYAFSQNGRRKAFTEFAIDNNMGQFDQIVDLFSVFRQLIDESIREIQINLAA